MRQAPGSRQKLLTLEYITKAEAQQRAGRTGRLANGVVYRLVPSWQYQSLGDFPKPEILTSNVSDVLLFLQEHLPNFDCTPFQGGVKDFLSLRLLDSLPKDQIERGYQDLEEGGAIVPASNSSSFTGGGRVTELGKLAKQLYFDIEYVALVFNGLRLGVVEDAVRLLAVFRQGTPFYTPSKNDIHFPAVDRLRLVDVRNACLPSASSDPLTQANAVKAWWANNVKRWRDKARLAKRNPNVSPLFGDPVCCFFLE